MEADDLEVEVSPLSGPVTRDGVTVEVQIYRVVGGNKGWTLEVVDHENASTVWEGTFDTDEAAYAEFAGILEADGITSFSAPTSTTLH